MANENRANQLYEPFILKDVEGFHGAKNHRRPGKASGTVLGKLAVLCRQSEAAKDKEEGYDAEVMVFHEIRPEDIHYIAIVSDHRMMTVENGRGLCGGPNNV